MPRGISAWLVTWDHAGEHARPPELLAAVLNPRLSGERVRQIVELLYVNAKCTYSERIGYANSKKFVPDPARFSSLDGAPWAGHITCGHNPWLFARLVDDLRVEGDDPGSRRLAWKERARPNSGKKAAGADALTRRLRPPR